MRDPQRCNPRTEAVSSLYQHSNSPYQSGDCKKVMEMSVWVRGRECWRGVCACACAWRSSTRWSSHPCFLHPPALLHLLLLFLLPRPTLLTSGRPLDFWTTSHSRVWQSGACLPTGPPLTLPTYTSKWGPLVELHLILLRRGWNYYCNYRQHFSDNHNL